MYAIQIVLYLKEAGWELVSESEKTVLQKMIPLAKACSQDEEDPLPVRQIHITRHEKPAFFVSISPDRKLLVSAGKDNIIKILSLPEGKLLGKIVLNMKMEEKVGFYDEKYEEKSKTRTVEAKLSCVAISPDWKIIATGGEDGSIRLWSLKEGKALHTMETGTYMIDDLPPEFTTRYIISGNKVCCIAISPNGKLLASGHSDAVIRLWSLPGAKPLSTFSLRRPYAPIHKIIFNPDSTMLAANNFGGELGLWYLQDNRELLKSNHGRIGFPIAISRRGDLLTCGHNDRSIKSIQLWHLPDCKQLKSLEEHTGFIKSISFNSEGNMLVSSCSDESVCMWNLEDSSLQYTIQTKKVPWEHTGKNWNVAFSPNNEIIIGRMNGYKDSIRIWRSSDGKTLQKLPDMARSSVVSTDGHLLVTGGDDINIITLWQLYVSRLLTKPLTRKDLDYVNKLLQYEQITRKERYWLEFIMQGGVERL